MSGLQYPLLEGVTLHAVKNEARRNRAGDDADGFTDAHIGDQGERFTGQAREGRNGLAFEPSDRRIQAFVGDDGQAQGDEDSPDHGADDIQQHTANGGDEYRHGFPL